MSRVAGISIGRDEYRVAIARHGLGPRRLIKLARVPLTDGVALRRLLRGADVRLVLPLQSVTHRRLSLPFRRHAQLAATAPLELLGQLPTEPDDAIIGWLPLLRSTSGTEVLAAVARATTLDAWRAPLAALLPHPPALVVAGVSLLHSLPTPAATVIIADGAQSWIGVRRDGHLAALRALDTDAVLLDGFAAEVARTRTALGDPSDTILLAGPDTNAALDERLHAATGAQIAPLTLPALHGFTPALATACTDAAAVALAPTRALLSLAHDTDTGRPSKRVARLAIAAGLIAALDLGIYRHRLLAEDRSLRTAMGATAAAALGLDMAPAAPREALEAALAARRTSERRLGPLALEVLRDVSARVPSDVALRVDTLALDRTAFRLHGRTDSYEHVDLLRRALGSSPLLLDPQTTDTHTSVEGHDVEFTLQAVRRAPDGATP